MPFKLFQVIEQSGVLEAPGLMYNNMPAVITTAVGQMVKCFFTCFYFYAMLVLHHVESSK
jgi:hypothetical protein